MANQFAVNVYQIDGRVLDRNSPIKFGFPTTNIRTQDVSGSPTRSLSSGYNVYGLIIHEGTSYYVAETFAQLATLIG